MSPTCTRIVLINSTVSDYHSSVRIQFGSGITILLVDPRYNEGTKTEVRTSPLIPPRTRRGETSPAEAGYASSLDLSSNKNSNERKFLTSYPGNVANSYRMICISLRMEFGH